MTKSQTIRRAQLRPVALFPSLASPQLHAAPPPAGHCQNSSEFPLSQNAYAGVAQPRPAPRRPGKFAEHDKSLACCSVIPRALPATSFSGSIVLPSSSRAGSPPAGTPRVSPAEQDLCTGLLHAAPSTTSSHLNASLTDF